MDFSIPCIRNRNTLVRFRNTFLQEVRLSIHFYQLEDRGQNREDPGGCDANFGYPAESPVTGGARQQVIATMPHEIEAVSCGCRASFGAPHEVPVSFLGRFALISGCDHAQKFFGKKDERPGLPPLL